MKITFLGATKIVTGSNFLVEAAGKKFLVDCGMYQGRAELELENYNPFDYNPADIDFMLLTHAHIDHSGRIPKLYNEGFKGPIYAHKATCDLCGIMLPDSGHIQEMESEWKNKKRLRKGEEALPPLYTAEDAINCQELFVPIKYDEIIQVAEEIYVRFNDAGHMLGSSIIEIWVKEDGKETKAVFSGDIGNNDIPLLSSPTMIVHSSSAVSSVPLSRYTQSHTMPAAADITSSRVTSSTSAAISGGSMSSPCTVRLSQYHASVSGASALARRSPAALRMAQRSSSSVKSPLRTASSCAVISVSARS